jgi:hypothetical protein
MNPATVPLLEENALQARADSFIEGHLRQSRLWVRGRKDTCEFASRLYERDRPGSLTTRSILDAPLRLVDQVTEFLGELRVTLAGGLSSHLHGDREESLFVAVRKASNQRFDLSRGRHGDSHAAVNAATLSLFHYYAWCRRFIRINLAAEHRSAASGARLELSVPALE